MLSQDSVDKITRLVKDFDPDDVINWAYAAVDELQDVLLVENAVDVHNP